MSWCVGLFRRWNNLWKCFAMLTIMLCVTDGARAQNFDPAGGSPPFVTAVTGQFDQLNLPSGNILLEFPVRSKAGKYPTTFSLVGNSHAYIGPPPQNSNYTGAWQVSSGFYGMLSGSALASNVGARAFATYIYSIGPCNNIPDYIYTNWVVQEANGTVHSFQPQGGGGGGVLVDSLGCQYPSSSGTTTDGSGYSITVHTSTAGFNTTLYDKSGNLLEANSLPASCNGQVYCATDSDGISMYGGTGINTGGPIVDTLGQTVINATLNRPTGSSWQDKYQYADASNNTQTVQVNWTQINTYTAFNCPNIAEVSPAMYDYPTSITYPDGETFLFSYESIGSGSTTGRIASITYPQGGKVSYTYSGVICAMQTGYPSQITRTVNDNNGNVNQWTYQISGLDSTYGRTVTETDPAGNVTVVYYGGVCNSQGTICWNNTGPTQRLFYQGSASASHLVSEQVICYDGANSSANSCIHPSFTSSSFPITQTDTYTYPAGPNGALGSPSDVQIKYDTYGNVTSTATYDYGVAFPPSGTPLTTTTTVYNTGNSCGTLSISAIKDRPCSITVSGPSGTVSQTNYTYNSAGHPVQTSRLVSGSTYLTSSASYNANGTIASATDVNQAVTNFYYNGTGGCTNLLLTSTVLPVNSLTMSQTWNCSGGVLTSSTDNNSTTNYGYVNQSGVADPMWRRLSTTDPLGNTTWNTFNTASLPFTQETSLTFNSNNSTVDTLTTFDGIGRTTVVQKRQAPNSSNFDSTQYIYGWTANVGELTKTSMPYVGARGSLAPGGTAFTTSQRDALGRTQSVTDGGGGTTNYQYTFQDVLVTAGPAPSGENTKRKQFEYDGAKRLKSVCELTTMSGSGTCGQVSSATGFWTQYSHDALGNLSGISQNAQGSPIQNRSFTYDGWGRLTSESHPESGSVTYLYDSSNSNGCVANYPGDLVQIIKASGLAVCFYYDPLHRLTDAGNNNEGASFNQNPCKRFRYDNNSGVLSNRPSGLLNTLGRVAEVETDDCTHYGTQSLTDEWFGYDGNGRNTDVYESTPHSGGYYHTTAGYWANGVIQSLGGVGQQSSYSYGVDGEGRPYSATQGSTNFVHSTTYNTASRPLTISLEGSDNDTYGYDPNTGRMTGYNFTVAGKSMVGTLNWNANGTLQQLAITDGFNSSGTQTCNYGASGVAGYDDLGRLVSANCAPVWSQGFSYDPFGNITKSGSITWMPGYNQSTNRYTLAGTSYDADGNLLKDTFHSYAWSAYGKATGIDFSACGTNGTCFTYDALDRVVENNFSGAYSEIEYSPVGKVAVMNGGTQLQAYVPLPGGAIMSPSPDSFWHTDWMGSVRLASTASSHSVTLDRAFAPFGEMYNTVIGGISNQAFATLTRNTISDEYDTPNRELHPNQGRWISPDPLGLGAGDPTTPQTWNRYAYVANNPLSYTDPFGLGQCDDQGHCTATGTGCFDGMPSWSCLVYEGIPLGENWANFLCSIGWCSSSTQSQPQSAPPKSDRPIKIHGKWCGPNWTGGKVGEYDPAVDESGGYQDPTDQLDAACMQHDMCYSSCRQANPCNPASRSSCFAGCDRRLSNGADNLPYTKSNYVSKTAIDLLMFFRGSDLPPFRPDPYANQAKCQ
jgi:RHS repeat-associated protein